MKVPADALVFDTGPMRHFAEQGWLGVLRFLAGDRPVYIPESVERELSDQVGAIPTNRTVLDSDWIIVHRSISLDFIGAFAGYEDRLVVERKNRGECGVLAMGKVYGCELILDDAVPRQIAEDEGLRVRATVPLLCDAIREKQLTITMVESLADHLLESEYFLPFGKGGFRQHVLENGLLEYHEL